METAKYIDISELDDIFGEMDIDETRETIESLQADFLLKQQELSECLAQNDIATFKLKAHSLKSNCCYLGASQLNNSSLKLETTHSFNTPDFVQYWEEFNTNFSATLNEIETALSAL